AVADAEDVRVHRDGRLAEHGIEDHVGSLAADARQRFQFFARARYLAAVAFQQQCAGRDEVLRLGVVQADRRDVTLQAVLAQREHFFRRVGDREQPPGGLVDTGVGGLRRQDYRHQQFERRAVLEFGGRVRIELAQAAEKFRNLAALHGRCPRLARPRAMAASTSAWLIVWAGSAAGDGTSRRRAARSARSRASRALRATYRLRASSARARSRSSALPQWNQSSNGMCEGQISTQRLHSLQASSRAARAAARSSCTSAKN